MPSPASVSGRHQHPGGEVDEGRGAAGDQRGDHGEQPDEVDVHREVFGDAAADAASIFWLSERVNWRGVLLSNVMLPLCSAGPAGTSGCTPISTLVFHPECPLHAARRSCLGVDRSPCPRRAEELDIPHFGRFGVTMKTFAK